MLLSDRYRFEKKVGEGGMAAVFKAHDLELDEYVAIKIFTREVSDEGAVARFKQELSLSRRLSHPNIIRLYDIGSWHGFRYISMELLLGQDLNNYLVGRPIDFKIALDWLIQSAQGLQGAHDRGVIHRDVKPHNIFVCDDGVVKVMDFGIAKRQSTPGVTVGNLIAGTPDYMSPEQIHGFSSVTHSTDIYALGVVAYQLFTGTLPFMHEELLPLLMMHINDAPPPPRSRNRDIPNELERIILRLLEKKPEERFSTCAALADALQNFRSRL
jgi:serine/threonine-protein kinase